MVRNYLFPFHSRSYDKDYKDSHDGYRDGHDSYKDRDSRDSYRTRDSYRDDYRDGKRL